MPLYEYRCESGHLFEVIQRMTDDSVNSCTQCGAPVQRVFHPFAVHFKGSGFYTTDYRRGKSGEGEGDSKGNGDSKADSKAETKKDAAAKESKASSSSD